MLEKKETKKDGISRLVKIQQELNAPKNQINKGYGYKFRSSEDILEAIKPLLARENLLLNLTDEIILINDRFYIKATATIFYDGEIVTFSNGFAREVLQKKGMDEAQITGASSSYARKYALNGLFLIDDSKDSDHTNKGQESTKTAQQKPSSKPKQQAKPPAQAFTMKMSVEIEKSENLEELKKVYDSYQKNLFGVEKDFLIKAKDRKKEELLKQEETAQGQN